MDYIETKLAKKNKRLQKNKKISNSPIEVIHSEKIKYFEELQSKILPEKEEVLSKYKKDLLTSSDKIKTISNKIKKEVVDKKLDDHLHELTNHITNQESRKNYCKKFPETKQLVNLMVKKDYFVNLKSKIQNLEEEILNIKNRREEIDYFVNTKDLLNEYYLHKNNSGELANKYYQSIGIKYDITPQDCVYKCGYCIDAPQLQLDTKGYFCDCGYTIESNITREHSKLSFKEAQEYKYIPDKYYYQRRTYFIQRLNQSQGKDELNVENVDKLISDIREQMTVENLSDKKINYQNIRRILKLKGYNCKYYEKIPSIIKKMTGSYPLNISKDKEIILIYMFDVVNYLYQFYQPKGSSNTIPINYYLYKFCEILGYNSYLPYFNLLKDTKKIHEKDVILEKIINHINTKGTELENIHNSHLVPDIEWKFIPTV